MKLQPEAKIYWHVREAVWKKGGSRRLVKSLSLSVQTSLYVYVSVSLPVCLSPSLHVWLYVSLCLSVCPFIMSLYLSLSLSLVSVRLWLCLSLYVYVSLCFPLRLSVYRSDYIHLCLSNYLALRSSLSTCQIYMIIYLYVYFYIILYFLFLFQPLEQPILLITHLSIRSCSFLRTATSNDAAWSLSNRSPRKLGVIPWHKVRIAHR